MWQGKVYNAYYNSEIYAEHVMRGEGMQSMVWQKRAFRALYDRGKYIEHGMAMEGIQNMVWKIKICRLLKRIVMYTEYGVAGESIKRLRGGYSRERYGEYGMVGGVYKTEFARGYHKIFVMVEEGMQSMVCQENIYNSWYDLKMYREHCGAVEVCTVLYGRK